MRGSNRSCLATRLAALALVAVHAAGCDGEAGGTGRPGASPDPAAADRARPSILLISLDTTRADRLGCYGHSRAETPHLDRLAAGGVLFENAATPVPITLPAHASLMTGLLPNRHGVRDNGLYRLEPGIPTLTTRLAAAGFDTAAVVSADVLSREYGLQPGFRLYDDDVQLPGGLAIAERTAGQVVDRTLQVAAGLREPYFLFVHLFDAHADYRPPSPFRERFAADPYDGEIAYMDQEIGRLVQGLTERAGSGGLRIVVTADHGEGLGEHQEATHGVFLYQSTLRVPLILAGPGIPDGRRIERFARLTDLMPTLLELSGLPAEPGIDGQSLVETWAGATPRDRFIDGEWLPIESDLGFNSYGWAPLRGLFDGRTKWIQAPTEELYDLSIDPRELRNLAGETPDRLADLAGIWQRSVIEDRHADGLADETSAEEAERLERLRSLGYVSASGRPSTPAGDLPDPKDRIQSIARINDARSALSAGKPQEAVAILEPIARVNPANLSAQVLLGSAWIEAGRPDLAIDPLRRAAELQPVQTDVQFNLGIALSSTGDLPGAEGAWRASLRASPRNLMAAANLIDLLQQSGRPQPAWEVLQQIRAEGVDSPVLDYLEGRIALQRGDGPSARAALTRALQGNLPPAIRADAQATLSAIPAPR